MKRFNLLSILVLGMLFVAACSTGQSSPKFFPNDHYRRVGPATADADAAQCMAMADQYVEDPSKWQDVAKRGVGGAAVGAGTGALAGTIMKGKVGRSTAAGATVGGIVGVASGLTKMGERNPSYERFVEHCLQQKGYQVVGWGN